MSVVYALNSDYSTIKLGVDTTEDVKAPKHIIGTIELTKNLNGSLNVPANIETTQINAPVAVLDTVNTEILIPKSGEGGDITILGNIDLSNNGLKNLSTLTLSTGSGVAGQVIGLNGDGDLYWKNDATADVSQWATYKAVQDVDLSQNNITNVNSVYAKTALFVGADGVDGVIRLYDSAGNNNVQFSAQYGGYFNINNVSSNVGSDFYIGAGSNDKNVIIQSDTVINSGKSLQLFDLKDSTGSSGSNSQVLGKDPTTNTLVWKNDAVADVSQWATYKAVQNVDLSQNDIINVDSITSTTVKTDVLDCANPSGTQINVAKNLNLSSNILYAGTINAGNTITSANAFFGVEPNRWTGADNYTLKQIDGDNRVVSDSGADLVGWHNVQSKRGKFYATNASDEEKFSATGDGAVSCVGITTTKLNIPSQTPAIGQVLGVSSTDGTLQWLDNTVYTPSLSQVLDVSNNAGNNNINMNGKYLTNADRVYTRGLWNYADNQDITIRLNGTNPSTRVVLSGEGYFDLGNHNMYGGDKITTHSINTTDIYEEFLNSGVSLNAELKCKSNNITGAGNVYVSQLFPTYKLQYDFFVSPNGSDISGNGSIEAPFSSVQKAITVCNQLTAIDNLYRYVHIAGGDYSSESLTITKKIHLIGEGSNSDACGVGCQLGNVSLAIDANGGDKFNNQVNFTGLLIKSITDTASTNNYVLNIVNCYIFSPSRAIYLNPTSPSLDDLRLWIQNTQILSSNDTSTDPLVEITKGMMKASLTTMTARGVQNVLKLSGSSKVDSLTLCQFVSSTNSTTAPAIVEITSSTSSVFTFGNSSFIYSNSANKAGNPSSCGIYANSSTASSIISILYNVFSLAGTTNTNYIVNHGSLPCITYHYSNSSTTTNTLINGNNNSTKFSLQAVN